MPAYSPLASISHGIGSATVFDIPITVENPGKGIDVHGRSGMLPAIPDTP